MEKAITNTTNEYRTNAANSTTAKKRRPAFPEVWERQGGLFDSLF